MPYSFFLSFGAGGDPFPANRGAADERKYKFNYGENSSTKRRKRGVCLINNDAIMTLRGEIRAAVI